MEYYGLVPLPPANTIPFINTNYFDFCYLFIVELKYALNFKESIFILSISKGIFSSF